MMSEEEKKRIEEIRHRISFLPDEMIRIDAKVPLRVPDPNNKGKQIECPHGRLIQTRYDIVDKKDFYKKPIIHFHRFPDHGVYEKNWFEFSEAFIHMKADLLFLIQKLEEKENATHD